MEVDINALQTYDRLARDGAHRAADSLTQLTDIETHVEMTDVSLVTQADLQQSYADGTYVGVQTTLTGALDGNALLTFDHSARGSILESLLPDGASELGQSGVTELGNIMISGFVDGWADHLDASIDISPPSYVEGSGASICPAVTNVDREYVFVFRSQVQAVADAIDFRLALLPTTDSFNRLIGSGGGQTIPMEKLSVFSEMTKQGAGMAADNIGSLTGLETDVEVSQMSFVPVSDVPTKVGNDRYVGTVMQFDGLPSGFLAILFDEPSGAMITDALVPTDTADTDGWSDMERSALQELGNIMTSGFIDGWANVLQTSIDHSPPEFVVDMGSSIVSPIAGRLAQTQDYAFVLDSTLEIDGGEFTCELFAFPERTQLTQALDSLLVERADQTEADFDSLL